MAEAAQSGPVASHARNRPPAPALAAVTHLPGIRPFFCQIEAVETAIWLTEVAPHQGERGKKFLDYLTSANEHANPGLFRIALKLATGAGKTTVIAMLIAWQTVNAVRRPASKLFTRGFLICTPGITIRDRLRVVLPSDPDNYYKYRELVPADLLGEIARAKIVITNFHAFKLRERLDVSKVGRALLKGRGPDLQTTETEGQMLQRVMPDLMGLKSVLVINDEAHHCYRHKVTPEGLDGDEDLEARGERRGGKEQRSRPPLDLRHRSRQTQARRPHRLRSLRHAVLPARLRLRRGHPLPLDRLRFLAHGRHRMRHRQTAPRPGRRQRPRRRHAHLPQALGTHRQKDAQERAAANPATSTRSVSRSSCRPRSTPSTATTKRPTPSGSRRKSACRPSSSSSATTPPPPSSFTITSPASPARARTARPPSTTPAVSNCSATTTTYGNRLARPRTLLIDSEQLESGEALDKDFREMASDEIERFRREMIERGDVEKARKITDADLLREVMNTVGKEGKLGEPIRCVVSVSMLTEGWDANTVTHILGVRAFGTQLLCEQVVGRGLRRQSYDLDEDGLLSVEYADILGIPFDFTAKPVVAPPKPPRPTVRVCAVRPERDALEIRFPRVEGYRVELPDSGLSARFTKDSALAPHAQPCRPVHGPQRGHRRRRRHAHRRAPERTCARPPSLFHLAKHLLFTKYRDPGAEPKLHLFGQLKRVVRQWMDGGYLRCAGGTYPAQVLYREIADMACERIKAAITETLKGENQIKAILDAYNPAGLHRPRQLHHLQARPAGRPTPRKCHINWIVCDSDWEAEFCRVAEAHPRVRAYVKNQGLGLEVPYLMGTHPAQIPARLHRPGGRRPRRRDPLNLIVEIKGFRGEDAKEKANTMRTYWVPGVNNLGKFGRWAFAEFTSVFEIDADFDQLIQPLMNANERE